MNIHEFKGKVPDKIYKRLCEYKGIPKRPIVRVGSIIKIVGCLNHDGAEIYFIRENMGKELSVKRIAYRKWNYKDTSSNDIIITAGGGSASFELGHWELVKY